MKLLGAVPRRWLEQGKKISLDRMVTYFGPVSLEVESRVGDGLIEARYSCCPGREPARLLVRLPHPDGYKAVRVEGGEYDPVTETIEVREPHQGTIRLYFER